MARICMVAYTYYPTDSRIRREAEALIDRGDTVDMIGLRNKDKETVHILNGVRLISLSVVRYRGSSVGMYLLNYFLFFVSASISLFGLYLRNHYQIIQVHTMPDFMVFIALVPKLLGAKVILDIHDLMPELYQSKFGFNQTHWLIRFITWMERCSIGFADRAIAVHKPHLDALIRHGNPAWKFTILLNLPDPKIFANSARVNRKKDFGFKLIYHGTVAERYGLMVVLRAIATLRDEIKGLKFEVFGEGDGLASLIALAKELDLNGCVNLSKDWVPLEKLVPILLDADVGVVPIYCDEFTKYMLPTKLLEYVALGIPVICSRTVTIEAYFDDSMVQYSTPGDIAELAEHIRDLYHNLDKRELLKNNAEKFNQEYNWESQKQFYYELIDNLNRKNFPPGDDIS